MFKYMLALLLAPLLRPIFNVVIIVLLITIAVTVPARLWVMFVDPRPSYDLTSVLNVATFTVLLCVGAMWRVRRRNSMRRSYLRRSVGRTR